MKGPTLDQLRAQAAWNAVEHVRQMKENIQQDYLRESRRLSVRIRTAGLGQALAFLYAKRSGDDAKSRILSHLSSWLLRKRKLAKWRTEYTKENAVIRAVLEGDADLLRRATEEAQLYLMWITRFAQAEFGGAE